ncbi:uncharacterized protein [Blastocystis hominis]|uniref:1,4-alpha-glucan branching enzyme n=1 Tax=Blastocystis hominis TaxID=12968 RepID=D8MAE6_BLAHO|nr:uncharacterized protein [Blastocystis hominis]CBK25035.2 unnamed protein product [Blastocystis hominis]|eukprot:XP_012899083.1 uncharacterized protein [Blastocystis hominis]
MSGEDPCVSSYCSFEYSVLPRVIADGYNCIQFMAIVEHAYYPSFGYQCNLFYAISSRFGTPTDFMRLVDACHAAGLFVIVDIVQGHASPNVEDGINQFDGSDDLYFAPGEAGNHSQWGSKCFDYRKREVTQFLLGQLLYFVEVYHIDGFRFDAVTSIIYNDHAITRGFTGNYEEYFGFYSNINIDGLAYLAMANRLLHSLEPPAFSIAEDVSGYPLLASPMKNGGIGFDYRMNMAVADKWIKLMKESKLELWNVTDIAYTITNRRYGEKYVSYNECHDQSLVGDKTLAFWLMDAEMYSGMSKLQPRNHTIFNGIHVLHLIRLLTKVLGGEGYLNFMGNEFGHPGSNWQNWSRIEWVDFPRKGNNFSYHYCRRQWSLVDDRNLLYQYILNWDVDTNRLCAYYSLQVNGFEFITLRDQTKQVLAFEKGGLLFVFNFSYSNSYSDYQVPVRNPGSYRCILSVFYSLVPLISLERSSRVL